MRYKEQAMNLLEKVANLVTQVEQGINRNESRESVLTTVDKLKEKLEQLNSQISIEPGDFFTSK